MRTAAVQGLDGRSAARVNEVRLVGRVSGAPETREMPSGDTLLLWRLVVPRDEPRRRRTGEAEPRRLPTVDTIDIACWSASARRAAARLTADDIVEVTGALRRRFFRGGSGAQSRYEVEARAIKRRA